MSKKDFYVSELPFCSKKDVSKSIAFQYNKNNEIECPKCKSMQIEQTMHRGYNYLYCENCGSLLDYDGNIVELDGNER